ncbi:MAG: ATP-grasp domain-containing protein [Rhizobiales bacterium]|nr:ATP-grasp domain-containing protein [Hyphomicrobiales bacterium]
MIESLLIANRGEIAVRIARTCKALGVRVVAVVSDADRHALHAELADAVAHIGPAEASASYLDGAAIIRAAREHGAEAVHPGYGFLSENAEFADACAAAGLVFVGPDGATMRRLGFKDEAKALAEAAGVPTVPGWRGDSTDAAAMARAAKKIGFPLMVKAVAGGGGRGMRLVREAGELAGEVASARREAEGAFGDGRLMLERLVVSPRHIEVQVFGDGRGNVVHLFERDCSLQRRHQKVIEEAPAPGLSPAMRAAMTDAAVRLAASVSYRGAGTVEFLLEEDAEGGEPRFYFIEMNTRLQVEHPVTELVTGLDLVEWQLRIASGEGLPLAQQDIRLCGHAVEARIYAEDPARDFAPQSGPLHRFELAEGEGIRIDTGVRAGDEITPYYDPMIAKLIAGGGDRREAFGRLASALAASEILGPRANARFLLALARNADVLEARLDTGLIARQLVALTAAPDRMEGIAAGVSALLAPRRGLARCLAGPWGASDGYVPGANAGVPYTFSVDGKPMRLEVTSGGEGERVREEGGAWVPARGDGVPVVLLGQPPHTALTYAGAGVPVQVEVAFPRWERGDAHAGGDNITAPINGRVVSIAVEVGATVAKGATVAVVEAMKMEHVLVSPRDGRIASVAAAVGDQVGTGQLLVALAPQAVGGRGEAAGAAGAQPEGAE